MQVKRQNQGNVRFCGETNHVLHDVAILGQRGNALCLHDGCLHVCPNEWREIMSWVISNVSVSHARTTLSPISRTPPVTVRAFRLRQESVGLVTGKA